MPLGERLDVPDSGIPARAARDGASTTSAGIGARREAARPRRSTAAATMSALRARSRPTA